MTAYNLPPGCTLADVEGPSMRCIMPDVDERPECRCCGKETDRLRDGLCRDCREENDELPA